jgi:quercetin dioxygenase-like cupin family protein
MNRKMIVVAACVLGLFRLAAAREKDKAPSAKATAGKGEAVMLAATEVKWGPPPPVLPPGAQLGVLHGDPGKPGLFAIRFKMPDGYKIAPHWHTNDEELTILSGTFVLSMGDKLGENAHTLTAGAYHFLPGKMHHAAQAKGETMLELHGMGPFDLHYLNPADDPSKTAATAK